MAPRRVLRDAQLPRDLLRGAAVREQERDVRLPRGEAERFRPADERTSIPFVGVLQLQFGGLRVHGRDEPALNTCVNGGLG